MSDYSIKATITADDSGYQKAVKNTIKATDDMGSSLASTFSSLRDIMQGPIAAINMAKQSLDGMWDATIGQAGKMEDMTAAFTPLVGGAENAAEMIAALNREAATTPFELEGIGNVAKQLLPVLGNDVNAVTDTFRMLGDTAGGNINKLDSITRGYVKTMNSGKVSLEALNMISDAGVPIQNQLADSMGISVQQMYKMITAGDVSSDELTKAFQKMTSEGGLFFNGMDIASQTLNGKLSSMTDAFKMSGAAIGNVFLPIIKDIVTLVSEVVGGFASWANTGDNLKSTMITVAQIIATVAAAIAAYTIVSNAATAATTAMGIATKIAAAAQAILNAIMTANPLGLIVAGIALVVGAIIIIVDKMGGWKIAFLEVQKVALIVVGAILDYFSWFTNNLISIVNIALGVYNKVAGVIGAKPIKLIDEVDLKTAAGITDKIIDINNQIREEKKAKAELAIQDDKTNKTIIANKDAEKDKVKEVSSASIEWADKVSESVLKNLEDQRTKAVDIASKRGLTEKELSEELIGYDDKIYELYIANIEKKRNADIEKATKDKESASTIADITKYYDDQITAYKEKQTDARIKDLEKYAKAESEKAAKRVELEADVTKKLEDSRVALLDGSIDADEKELASTISKIKAEEDADEKKAELLGANEETIADIHETAQNRIVKATEDAAEKQIAAGKTIGDAFTNTFNDLAEKANSWNDLVGEIVSTVGSYLKDSLIDVGAALVTGTIEWSDFGVAALDSLAGIISAIGDKLVAEAAYMALLAAEHLLLGDIAGAAAATAAAIAAGAGAAAAYVTSGVVSGLADQIEEVADAEKEVADTSDDVAGATESVASAVTAVSDATAAASDAAAETAATLASLMEKYEDANKTTLELINEERDEQLARAKLLGASEEQLGEIRSYYAAKYLEEQENISSAVENTYDIAEAAAEAAASALASTSDLMSSILGSKTTEAELLKEEMTEALQAAVTAGEGAFIQSKIRLYYAEKIAAAEKAATKEAVSNAAKTRSAWAQMGKYSVYDWNTNIKYIFDSYSIMLDKLTDATESFYSSFENIGTDIASSLISNISDGLNQSDFLTTMKEYITKMVVQAVVYTDSLNAKIAAVGTKIADAIAGGFTGYQWDSSGIVDELKAIYASASSASSEVSAIVSKAFTGYASGTDNATAGWHIVGEQGPELRYFRGGETVIDANKTASVLSGGGSTTINATFNSPKAMNQYDQMRALKQYNRELRFKGVTA